jgi:hypothetical protein
MTSSLLPLVLIAVLAVAQAIVLIVTSRRLRQWRDVRERVTRLGDTIALLAETTETGLNTVIQEIERIGRQRPVPRADSRASVARRVVDAARRGDSVSRIAMSEALSESEVRLHLSMAIAGALPGRAGEAADAW